MLSSGKYLKNLLVAMLTLTWEKKTSTISIHMSLLAPMSSDLNVLLYHHSCILLLVLIEQILYNGSAIWSPGAITKIFWGTGAKG